MIITFYAPPVHSAAVSKSYAKVVICKTETCVLFFLAGVCMEKFYMISFESLCEQKDGTVIPLEIGCVEYSLCSGITKELHMFIYPGQIPMGFLYACKARSK